MDKDDFRHKLTSLNSTTLLSTRYSFNQDDGFAFFNFCSDPAFR